MMHFLIGLSIIALLLAAGLLAGWVGHTLADALQAIL